MRRAATAAVYKLTEHPSKAGAGHVQQESRKKHKEKPYRVNVGHVVLITVMTHEDN